MINPLSFLLSKKSVGILPHINPDWDALGSSLALRTILRSANVKADVIMPEPLSFHLGFMNSDVLVYNAEDDYDYDVMCAVDVSTFDRLGDRSVLFDNAKETAWIDHHLTEEVNSPVSCINPNAAATAEVIYTLMCDLDIPVDKEIGTYLYCALTSDTGSFRYANTTAKSAELLQKIILAEVDIPYLANQLYFRTTLPQMKLRAAAVNTIELFEEGKIGIALITDEMVEKSGATKSDTSALSDVPRSIESVMISAVIRQEDDGFSKVSFRSKGEYDVERIAAIFGGGGHVKASGATIKGSVEEVRDIILPHLAEAVK
ncbi:MAG: bifunctional oligoribonuclease/PAP phosphatase NrnA [Clostridia bacterium]